MGCGTRQSAVRMPSSSSQGSHRWYSSCYITYCCVQVRQIHQLKAMIYDVDPRLPIAHADRVGGISTFLPCPCVSTLHCLLAFCGRQPEVPHHVLHFRWKTIRFKHHVSTSLIVEAFSVRLLPPGASVMLHAEVQRWMEDKGSCAAFPLGKCYGSRTTCKPFFVPFDSFLNRGNTSFGTTVCRHS
jgi:hypothetical protein